MTDVLVVGMAVADFLFEVPSMPAASEKYVAHNACIVGGGGAANAACAISKLGGEVCLAARVGDDLIGRIILDDLHKLGVDCSQIAVTAEARSSFSSVLLDAAGERQIVNYRGANLSDDTRSIEMAKPGAFLADTRWRNGAIAAMRRAAELKVPGVLDAEQPLLPEAMALASHIAFSRQGLESFTSVDCIEVALQKVADQYPVWVGMTDGADGVYALHGGEFTHFRTTSVKVVDTLGAGDVWHGAFAYSLASGDNEEVAVKFANATATLKCMRAGGGRVSPDRQEVERFMRDNSD